MEKLLLAFLLATAPCVTAQTNSSTIQPNSSNSSDEIVTMNIGRGLAVAAMNDLLNDDPKNKMTNTTALLSNVFNAMNGDPKAIAKIGAPGIIAPLTDPAKLATLKGERAANPRLQKCVYWLAMAEEAGEKPEAVLDEAAKLNGTAGTPYAGFVRWGLLENLKIAKELGLLTPEGMAELRRGNSATITKGQYFGEKAVPGYVIPITVCPELANQVMNLELLPASLNRSKSDKVTERARVFAKELYDAKLLSEEGWRRVGDISSK